MSDGSETAYSLTADALGLTVVEVLYMAAVYDFSDAVSDADREGFQKTADFLFASGMIDAPFDTSALYLN